MCICALLAVAVQIAAAPPLHAASGSTVAAHPPLSATAVGIGRPAALAPDGRGGFYVAAPDLERVLHVDREGRLTTAARAAGVHSVACNRQGALFLVGRRESPVGRVDTARGTVEPLFGIVGTRVQQAAGMAMDNDGSLFVADRAAHCVYRIRPDGIFVRVAGDGLPGSEGDGGQGSRARLSAPEGLALSPPWLFIADRGNHCVRRLDLRSGVIDTPVGQVGIEGDPVDGANARSSRLRDPLGLAVNRAGDIFVSDLGSRRLHRVHARTGTLTELPLPPGVLARELAVDHNGKLLLGDVAGRKVWRCSMRADCTAVAGDGGLGYGGDGGPATLAHLVLPVGLARDREGNLFVADQGAHRIRRIDARGTIETVAGDGVAGFSGDDGPARAAMLNGPAAVAIDRRGDLLIADTGNHRIRRVSARGVITTVAGTGADGWPKPDASLAGAALGRPSAVGFDGDGALLVVQAYGQILRIDLDGGKIDHLSGVPRDPRVQVGEPIQGRSLGSLQAVAFAANGDILYSESGGERLCRIVRESGRMRVEAGVVLATDAVPGMVRAFPDVTALAVDHLGRVYAAGHTGLLRVSSPRAVERLERASELIRDPLALLSDADRDAVYVADRSGSIWRLEPNGAVVCVAGGGVGF